MKRVHQTESFQGSELTEGVFHLKHGRLEPIGADPERSRVVRRPVGGAIDAPGQSSGAWFDGPHARTLLGVAPPVWPEDVRAHVVGRRRSTVDALVELLGPQLDEVGRDRLRRLRDEVAWMAAGPEVDLLAFDEAGEGFVEVSAIDLAHEARGRVLDRADAKDVEVVVHAMREGVRVQPRAFAEALCCLLENAIDASRRGYPVLLDVRETEGGDSLWQIHDHGQGISAETLARIGQPGGCGWRSDAERRVALAWGIVERHGGLLRFESATGVGTTVTVWLPRDRG